MEAEMRAAEEAKKREQDRIKQEEEHRRLWVQHANNGRECFVALMPSFWGTLSVVYLSINH